MIAGFGRWAGSSGAGGSGAAHVAGFGRWAGSSGAGGSGAAHVAGFGRWAGSCRAGLIRVSSRRPSADVQPGVLRLRWRRTARPIRHAVQRRRIPGRPAAQLWRGRVHAPRRRRSGARGSRRDPASSADRAPSRSDAGIAGDSANSRLRRLAFVDPRAATASSSSLGAVLQPGRAADDELAIVDKFGLYAIRTIGAVWCVAWLWHRPTAPIGLNVGRFAQFASAVGDLIADARITNNHSHGRRLKHCGQCCCGASRARVCSAATGTDGHRWQSRCSCCGRGCRRRGLGRRYSANSVAAHR